jgi:hypothetical protein
MKYTKYLLVLFISISSCTACIATKIEQNDDKIVENSPTSYKTLENLHGYLISSNKFKTWLSNFDENKDYFQDDILESYRFINHKFGIYLYADSEIGSVCFFPKGYSEYLTVRAKREKLS